MASPSYGHNNYGSSISPPYPSNAQLPQPPKRRQSDMPSSAPAIKRRKASMLSTSSATHPLRQTSFPPENTAKSATYSRSPSMDTMSMLSGVAPSSAKKKKPRKSKGKDNDDASVAGGRGSRAPADKGRGRSQTVGESDDGGDEPVVEASAEREKAKQDQEDRRLVLASMLDGNDPEGFLRYEQWRATKLDKATIRRIVNQTLSQSVPAPVIIAVQSAAKMFAGDLIERARKVQSQWLEASGESQTGDAVLPRPPAQGDESTHRETRRGPLMADHLREAFRRQMLENHGGLVGELGLWQHQQHSGVERFGVKVGGKRLLK